MASAAFNKQEALVQLQQAKSLGAMAVVITELMERLADRAQLLEAPQNTCSPDDFDDLSALPTLHRLEQKIDSGFAEVDKRFDKLHAEMDRRFEASKVDMDRRFTQVDTRIDKLHADMDRRFEVFQAAQQVGAAFGARTL